MIHAEGWENRMYFRFYDPRVLQAFLPTCTAEQLNGFFGPISRFFFQSDPSQEVMSIARDSPAMVAGPPVSLAQAARGGADT
jgi:hypothetical protein